MHGIEMMIEWVDLPLSKLATRSVAILFLTFLHVSEVVASGFVVQVADVPRIQDTFIKEEGYCCADRVPEE